MPEVEPEDLNLLVVESEITNIKEPFRVKLSRTFDVDVMKLVGNSVEDAEVSISDNIGNLFPLIHIKNGIYETEDKQLYAVSGNTYTLHILTSDGAIFESTPVLMDNPNDIPEIDSLYFEEEIRIHFENEVLIKERWLNILLDTEDLNNKVDYWKWNFVETWEVRTPKNNISLGDLETSVSVDYLEGNSDMGWDNEKERCWVIQPSKKILIKSNKDQSSSKIQKLIIHSIPPENEELDIKYSILVKQSSLSEESYQYWKKLKDVNEDLGNIYDKVPSEVSGNLICCNGDHKVLGYFNAYSVKSKRISILPYQHHVSSIDPYEDCEYSFNSALPIKRYYLGHISYVSNSKYSYLIDYKLYSFEPWCSDCRYHGTNVMPEYWNEE